jgi:DNA-binding NarL/FixJ family response regulator
MEIIRVVIVDDHLIFRKGLTAILNDIDDVKVVGEASNGQDALSLLRRQEADIVLMDIRMPVMDGIEATRKITEKYPAIKIIGLTMFEEISYFNEMIDAGACGFLLKKTNGDELEKAIHAVHAGDSFFSEEFMGSVTRFIKPRQKQSEIKLSDREIEVLKLICKGFSNNEISDQINLSVRTIDGHRAKLLEKTGAKNAPNLVMWAIENGVL